MGNVSLFQKNQDRPAVAAPERSRDPLPRHARLLLSSDPFREMVPSLALDEERALGFAPAFDVKETPEAYVFRADVPGVRESDIEVLLTGNRLTISGKREQESEGRSDRYYTYERSYGTFSRSFTLPDGADGDSLPRIPRRRRPGDHGGEETRGATQEDRCQERAAGPERVGAEVLTARVARLGEGPVHEMHAAPSPNARSDVRRPTASRWSTPGKAGLPRRGPCISSTSCSGDL